MATASADAATGVTGLDLRLARVAVGITQIELARRMGVPRQRVSLIEAALRPPEHQVERFLAALGSQA